MLSAAGIRARWVSGTNIFRPKSPTASAAPSVTPRSAVRTEAFDSALVWVVILLCAIGIVMVYSSSIAAAESSKAMGYRAHYFLVRQVAYLCVGFVAAVVMMQVPVRVLMRWAPVLFGVAVILLVAVLFSRPINGSRRWLMLPGLSLQPSEIMKLAAILFAARYAVRKGDLMHGSQPMKISITQGLLPMLGVLMLVGYLLLKEPDFGATIVVFAISFGILFLANLDFRLLVPVFFLATLGLVLLVVFEPYRLQRWTVFLDPWADPLGKGYQLTHSLMAFGRGGWFGAGLGTSVEKLLYLPEAHTDFILAVIGEEFGLIGVGLVIGLFAWLTYRAFAIGKFGVMLNQPFHALVAQGIGIWIGFQALINIAVNVGAMPTKGLTLPLLSYGGSALVMTLAALGVLVRIDWELRRIERGYQV
jgi:cell division protein FtsW